MPFPFTKCRFCDYKTDVKCNLIRHQNAKHKDIMFENDELSKTVQKVNPNGQKVNPNEQKVNPNEQKVNPNEQKVNPNEQKVNPNNILCKKCNKVYKTLKHLYNHEKVCNKVDNLTCPRCMFSFTTKQAKSRHIKANKCKARSIVHARTPNIQNITNNNTTNNIQNNINNIFINNFGSERIDHISHAEIMKMLQSGNNTIPLYIKKKHFDKNFPENNNIKYSNDNKCQVLEDNCWQEKDIGLLSTNLMKDNTEVLLMYCDNNEIQLLNEIKDIEKYEHIRNKLFIVYNKSDNQKYNAVLSKIKELVKNSISEFELL